MSRRVSQPSCVVDSQRVLTLWEVSTHLLDIAVLTGAFRCFSLLFFSFFFFAVKENTIPSTSYLLTNSSKLTSTGYSWVFISPLVERNLNSRLINRTSTLCEIVWISRKITRGPGNLRRIVEKSGTPCTLIVITPMLLVRVKRRFATDNVVWQLVR